MKNKIKIAFIGCGHMASAIIRGLLSPASVDVLRRNGDVFRLTLCDCDEKKLMPFKADCEVSLDNHAAEGCDYVVLAVKPQDFERAVSGLCLSDKVVISVMAGVSAARLRDVTGSEKTVRIMPNINAAVGEAFSAYSCFGLDGEQRRVVCEIMGSYGAFEEMDESLFDAVTGVSGSGAAFVYLAMRAFVDEAVSRGIPIERAVPMVAQTFLGSARMAESSDLSLTELIDSVCSPGGTTALGVESLKKSDVEGALRTAIGLAADRAKELGR